MSSGEELYSRRPSKNNEYQSMSEAQVRDKHGRHSTNRFDMYGEAGHEGGRRGTKGASLQEALATRPSVQQLTPGWTTEGDTRGGASRGVNPQLLQRSTAASGVSPTQVNAAALQRLGRSGMPGRLGDLAAMQQAQASRRAQLGGAAQQQRAAARQMGVSGGGSELAAQLGAIGGVGAMSAQDAAAMGAAQTDRQLAAQREMAGLASLYRDQAFEEARRVAGAQDQTELFNTSYQQAVRQRDMDRLARASLDQAKARDAHRRMGLTSLQATQADRDYIENVERMRRAAENKEQIGIAGLIGGGVQKVGEIIKSIFGGG